MGFSNAAAQALNRLKTFYNGDPYGAQNQGGMDNDGHRLNFIPSLRDLSLVGGECATLVDQAAAAAQKAMDASAASPKAVRVDADQNYSAAEQAQGQKNLGLASVLTAFVKKAGGDDIVGMNTIRYTRPMQQWYYAGKAAYRLGVLDDATFSLLPENSDTPLFSINGAGAVSTAQIGDLNSRIETRGAAYRDAAILATLPRTGGRLTGTMYAPNIVMEGADGSILMNSRNNKGTFTVYNFDDVWRVYYNQANLDMFQVFSTGAIATNQLGDLNTRIENRGAAYRDAALATARSELFSKAGGTVTGNTSFTGGVNFNSQAQINSGAGEISFYFTRNGANNVRQVLAADNNFYIHTMIGAGDYYFGFKPDGGMTIPQFGDLNSRIEARALAYADQRVTKTGDTMTGNLTFNATVSGGSPGTRYIMPNNADWLVRGIGGNQLQFCDGAVTVQYFSFGTDGSFWTRQLGDLAANVCFPGALMFSAAPNPPAGWLRCNGSNLSRTTYPRLFAAIGGTYGAPNADTFNIPDVRGYFLRPLDEGRGADPAGGGRGIGSYQGSDNLSHSHGLSNGSGSIITAGSGANVGSGPYLGIGSLQASGGGEARPQNLAFPVYIKY